MSYVFNGKPVILTLYIGVPFDNKYEHHLFRDVAFRENDLSPEVTRTTSVMTMEDFLSVYKDSTRSELKFKQIALNGVYNFDFSNGLVTTVVVEVPHEFVNSNYLMVKGSRGEKPFYYFVTSFTILNATETNSTVKFELECDVMATYGADFFEGIKNKPLFTERKHCQRYSPYQDEEGFCCSDLSMSEDVTINCKPSVIENIRYFKLNSTLESGNISPLWCYITRTKLVNAGTSHIAGISMPTTTYVFPLVNRVNYSFTDFPDVNGSFEPMRILSTIYNNENVVGIRFTPYPPFTNHDDIELSYSGNIKTDNLVCDIEFKECEDLSADESVYDLLIHVGNNEFKLFTLSETLQKVFVLLKQTDVTYKLNQVNLGPANKYVFPLATKPTLETLKSSENEPKLHFSPCAKYEIVQRGGKNYEFHPEIVAIQEPLTPYKFELNSYATYSLIDNTYSTYIKFGSINNPTWWNLLLNRGLVVSNNYTFPNGENALKNFQATQEAQHVSKTIASVIGGVITTGAGFASGNYAIGALGATSVVSSIANSTSKYIDLNNTPEQLTNSGSNIFQDLMYAYTGNYEFGGLLPKIVVTELTDSEKEMLLDYFYHYGYNVQRNCVFNDVLIYGDIVDKRLITRELFNYVKLNDSFNNHLSGINLPPIVVEKFNTIFNNGVTLWTLFNIEYSPIPTSKPTWEDFEPYFMKDTYENVEVII